MSFRDALYTSTLANSGGNVLIHVTRGDGVLGRRVQNHEFLKRDFSEPEDLGALGNEFTLELFVLGENYAAERNALMRVLNATGTSKLVHPRLGELSVQIGNARWSFDKKSKETFTVTFYRKEELTELVDSDTAAQLTEQCDAVRTATTDEFAGQFSVVAIQGTVGDAAEALLRDGMQGIKSITGNIDQSIAAVSDINLAITDVINSASDLVRAPLQLVSAVSAIINNVLNIDNDINRAFNAYRSIESSWGNVAPVPGNTPARLQEARNQAAMQTLFVTTAAVETSAFIAERAAAINITSNSQSPFESADDAYALRDELITTLDTIARSAGDALYRAVRDLQAQLVTHIDNHGNSLPRVKNITLQQTLPALVLAYQLYGDAQREDDIVRRNKLTNPCFVPAGTRLEILEAV